MYNVISLSQLDKIYKHMCVDKQTYANCIVKQVNI